MIYAPIIGIEGGILDVEERKKLGLMGWGIVHYLVTLGYIIAQCIDIGSIDGKGPGCDPQTKFFLVPVKNSIVLVQFFNGRVVIDPEAEPSGLCIVLRPGHSREKKQGYTYNNKPEKGGRPDQDIFFTMKGFI